MAQKCPSNTDKNLKLQLSPDLSPPTTSSKETEWVYSGMHARLLALDPQGACVDEIQNTLKITCSCSVQQTTL